LNRFLPEEWEEKNYKADVFLKQAREALLALG
jgi:hypothetical protein